MLRSYHWMTPAFSCGRALAETFRSVALPIAANLHARETIRQQVRFEFSQASDDLSRSDASKRTLIGAWGFIFFGFSRRRLSLYSRRGNSPLFLVEPFHAECRPSNGYEEPRCLTYYQSNMTAGQAGRLEYNPAGGSPRRGRI